MIYADIIVDISHENLDKSYQYAVPDEFVQLVSIGSLVHIPFGRGNRIIQGYIVGLSTSPKIDPSYIKDIMEVPGDGVVIESHLINLAYWIKNTCGATMNDALRTVIPVKRTVKKKEKKSIHLRMSIEQAQIQLDEYNRKKNVARARLIEALIENSSLDYDHVVNKLKISRTVLSALEEQNIIELIAERIYRNPIKNQVVSTKDIKLNLEQQLIANRINMEYNDNIANTYLIHGITGSGKTEVYMEVIDNVLTSGKQVIMLIPEIALTYQTVMRFYSRFGDRVSIMNSRLSPGERYDQYVRAKNGDIDIMIGPRSALFTPFQKLGLIIVDEEHEGSYKSESPPRYHGRDVAIQRAKMVGASVILGSATPSLEAYKKALDGEYVLFKMNYRAGEGELPKVHVVDLREELKKRNKSIFSGKLRELIQDRLDKKEQIMIFINRRGYAGFVSCRSCGHVMRCPHCDVSLTSHNNGKLVCHYCGYNTTLPGNCPSCHSKYIAAFGTGTQKVEALIQKEYPTARVLRMDMDTTSQKDGHEKILSAFANHQADILVGTQMIVKGHDFPYVTLVGIIAADLSLYANDYRAGERTYQLLTQASGRAGRGKNLGEVVIQTYNPEHYSVQSASKNDYEGFYHQEMTYRRLMNYPPAAHILLILISSIEDEKADQFIHVIEEDIKTLAIEGLTIIGPTKAQLSKVKDIYRHVIYLKHLDLDELVDIKNELEGREYTLESKGCNMMFDFNPMNNY